MLVVNHKRSLVVFVVFVVVVEPVAVFMMLVVVLVGVTREVLLLVQADGVLGLVKQRLVGSAGGAGGRGVGVLLAGELVGGGLGGGLLGVGDHVAVEEEGQLGVSMGEEGWVRERTAGPCRRRR